MKFRYAQDDRGKQEVSGGLTIDSFFDEVRRDAFEGGWPANTAIVMDWYGWPLRGDGVVSVIGIFQQRSL